MLAGGSAIVAVCAVLVFVLVNMLFRSPPVAHHVTLPVSMDGYVKQASSASAAADAFRQNIVSVAKGEVSHVVAAVYERATGPGTSSGPQIIVFIGGNLSGGSFISDFMGAFRGSVGESAGTLGGEAACAPGANGAPAECAWADGDTFGVLVSATLTVPGLAQEMQKMRPLVEHAVR